MMYKSSKNDALAGEEPRPFFQRIDLSYWAPPVLWMAAIFLFSTDLFSGSNTGGIFYRFFHLFIPSLTLEEFRPWNFLIRKLSHFTEYAILAMVVFRAFRFGSPQRWRWTWAASTLIVVAFYALLDEYHQTWTVTRVGSIYDSMIDVSGGATALFLLWLWRRRG